MPRRVEAVARRSNPARLEIGDEQRLLADPRLDQPAAVGATMQEPPL